MTENVVYDGPVEERAPGSREVPGSNPGWMTMTEQSNANIADHLAKQVDDIQDVPGMKAVLMKMVEVIKRQDDVIYQLKGKLNKTEERSIDNTNSIHQLNERVTEVEKYSRKLCLIFTNVQQKGDPITSLLYLFSEVLKVNMNATNLAACHPLSQHPNAPIIAKFIFHADRDIIWRRRHWLKGITNSDGKPVLIEECLTPRDREIRVEAKRKGLQCYTRKQDVYVFDQNNPSSDAVRVTSVDELDDFTKRNNENVSDALSRFRKVMSDNTQTPCLPPPLTRKPTTIQQSVKKRKLQLTPVQEANDTSSLAQEIVAALLPAIRKIIPENNKLKEANDNSSSDEDGAFSSADK